MAGSEFTAEEVKIVGQYGIEFSSKNLLLIQQIF